MNLISKVFPKFELNNLTDQLDKCSIECVYYRFIQKNYKKGYCDKYKNDIDNQERISKCLKEFGLKEIDVEKEN